MPYFPLQTHPRHLPPVQTPSDFSPLPPHLRLRRKHVSNLLTNTTKKTTRLTLLATKTTTQTLTTSLLSDEPDWPALFAFLKANPCLAALSAQTARLTPPSDAGDGEAEGEMSTSLLLLMLRTHNARLAVLEREMKHIRANAMPYFTTSKERAEAWVAKRGDKTRKGKKGRGVEMVRRLEMVRRDWMGVVGVGAGDGDAYRWGEGLRLGVVAGKDTEGRWPEEREFWRYRLRVYGKSVEGMVAVRQGSPLSKEVLCEDVEVGSFNWCLLPRRQAKASLVVVKRRVARADTEGEEGEKKE